MTNIEKRQLASVILRKAGAYHEANGRRSRIASQIGIDATFVWYALKGSKTIAGVYACPMWAIEMVLEWGGVSTYAEGTASHVPTAPM